MRALSPWPTRAGPKPELQGRVKARQDREHAAKRKRCLKQVYARDGMRCQDCGRHLVEPFMNDQPLSWAQGDEIVLRSRGGSDTDPDNVILRCAACHNRRHGAKSRRAETFDDWLARTTLDARAEIEGRK